MRPPAVLLGGVGASLSVARSLSRHGVRVHVLGDRGSVVRASRCCHEFVDLGSGDGVQDRWREWLSRGPRGAVVLPIGDDGLELVARHRAWLEGSGYVPIEANDETLLAMLDKNRTHEVAMRADIAAPPTIPVGGPMDAATVAEKVGFPCALKPLHSHLFARHFDVKVFVADDVDDFVTIIERTNSLGLEMLATEIIPGGDDRYRQYYTYIGKQGEPLCGLTVRKIRQYPIHFGLGTYFVTDRNPEVAAEGLRFCQEIGLRGLANVEFKRDARDGSLKLIECNHRFTALNEVVRVAGLDLAVLTYDYLLGNRVKLMPEYRAGVRLWGPLEDLKAVKEYRQAGEFSYASWITSLLYKKNPYFFDWRDPGPTLYSFFNKVINRLGRLLGRSEGGR